MATIATRIIENRETVNAITWDRDNIFQLNDHHDPLYQIKTQTNFSWFDPKVPPCLHKYKVSSVMTFHEIIIRKFQFIDCPEYFSRAD